MIPCLLFAFLAYAHEEDELTRPAEFRLFLAMNSHLR